MAERTEAERIIVADSWKMPFGVLADLHHCLDGLPAGMLLRSLALPGRTWRVRHRIRFSHVGQQRVFASESLNPFHLRFSSPESMERSAAGVLQRERQAIYQYLLEGIGDAGAPAPGEILRVVAGDADGNH